MKKVWILFLVVFLTLPVSAYTLKGGVTYTVESARKEAFADVKYSISSRIIKNNKFDPNYEENKKLIQQGIVETNDRYITYFSDGQYGIIYKNNLYYEFSYFSDGKLESVGVRTGLVCPIKVFVYDINNKLAEIRLQLSTKESYNFSVDGRLLAHWINGVCYDINGKVIKRTLK